MFSLRVSTLLIVAVLYLPSVAKAGDWITLACVDCYGTSSLYAQETAKLFPGKKIRWIHIQTEKEIQEEYRGSFDASRHVYGEDTFKFDLDSEQDQERLKQVLRDKGVYFAFGGMETGAMRADSMNEFLFNSGLCDRKLGNDPATSHLRREKKAMQDAVRARYKIATLLTDSPEDAVAFANRHAVDGVFIKPDASSASNGAKSLRYTNPNQIRDRARYGFFDSGAHLRAARLLGEMTIQQQEEELRASVSKLRGETDFYGHSNDRVIVQPTINFDEHVANTIAAAGRTTLVANWLYNKVGLSGGIHSYLIDLAGDLTSPLCMDLQSAMQEIQSDVKLTDGPGHGENFYAPNTGDRASNWYFGEIGARAAGAGMSMVDEQIWGTSHLHLNILRVLDPARFEKEIASFPRKKIRDAVVVSLIAYADGRFKAGALDFIRSLPGYFSPAPFYEIKDGQQFTKTKDLNSIAATISFVGSTAQVRKSAMRLIEAVNDGKIFDYSVPNGFLKRCSHVVGNYFQQRKIRQIAEKVLSQ